MELSADYLREKLRQDLEAEHVEVEDTTLNRCATSFRVLVVSAKFEGKPLLQRHRLVNECLAEELPHIHAFEQKTLTPEQWTRQHSGRNEGLRPEQVLNFKPGKKKNKTKKKSVRRCGSAYL